MEKLKKTFRPHKCLGALIALLILHFSAPLARADIKWTIVDLQLDGFFGVITVTGTFDQTSKGYSSSNITAVEVLGGGTTYTYTFAGRLNGKNYNNVPSQQPPTLCIIAGCSPGESFPPQPVTLNIDTVNVLGPPGPYYIGGSSFEDNEELFAVCPSTHLCEVIGTTAPTPEPSFWPVAWFAFAGVGLWVIRMRQRRA